jgi:hypothetical protein
MTINNRLSMQYLDIKDDILKNICNNFNGINELITEIDNLDAKIVFNEIIKYNNIFGKADFIFIKKENTIMLSILNGTSPDINLFIYNMTLAIIYNLDKEEDYKIKNIQLYLPLSGLIYKVNITSISDDETRTFLNQLTTR